MDTLRMIGIIQCLWRMGNNYDYGDNDYGNND